MVLVTSEFPVAGIVPDSLKSTWNVRYNAKTVHFFKPFCIQIFTYKNIHDWSDKWPSRIRNPELKHKMSHYNPYMSCLASSLWRTLI